MAITVHPPLSFSQAGQRPHNEDYLSLSKERSTEQSPLVYIVCDGVGGGARGEIASAMVAQVMNTQLQARENGGDITAAVQNAQRAIDNYVKMAPEARGMATTLTLLYLDGDTATLAHMGDSRIYHLRGTQLMRRTQDHSLVQELLTNDLITPEQARNHPQRNVITRAINEQIAAVGPEVLEVRDLMAGDLFFLCSDGILEAFNDEELTDLLGRPTPSDAEKMAAIEARCTEQSRDNFTACLIRLGGVGVNSERSSTPAESSVASSLRALLSNLFG